MRLALLALVLFSLVSVAAAQQLQELQPQTIQEISAMVTLSASGVISGELKGKVTLKVLSFQETANQSVSVLKQVLEINGKTLNAVNEFDGFGNRYAVFEVWETGDFAYTIEARVRKRVKPRPLLDFNISHGVSEQADYLKPTKYIQSNAASIRTLALNKFKSASFLETVAEITSWTRNYVTYDKSFYPETYSAIETLKSKRGTCDEFATLSAALLRAKGIPVRVVVGPVFSAEEWNFHGWIEAFNPNTGWIPIDSTYGEAGLVDATHLEMGWFPDFNHAVDIVLAPSSARVEIQPKTIKVRLLDAKPFSSVLSLKAESIELHANAWQDLNVVVENKLNATILAPLSIALPKGFVVEEESKTVLLKPFEKKTVSWKVLIRRALERNQYLQGEYLVFSLHPVVSETLRILPEAKALEIARVEVLDLYAVTEGSTLKIFVLLENRGADSESVEIVLKSGEKEIKRVEETLSGLEQKTVIIAVENFGERYAVSVKAPGLEYTSTVVPEEELKAHEEAQKSGGQKNGDSANEPLAKDALMLAAIVFSTVAIVFLLKELVFK